MLSIYTKPNVVFVEGNHDTHLRNWAMDSWELSPSGKPRQPREFMFRTLPQLLGQKERTEFEIGIVENSDGKILHCLIPKQQTFLFGQQETRMGTNKL